MAIVKQSFLSNIIGRKTYDEFKGYAKVIIAIGTCVLSIILLLSLFFHWSFINNLLSLVTGTSLYCLHCCFSIGVGYRGGCG